MSFSKVFDSMLFDLIRFVQFELSPIDFMLLYLIWFAWFRSYSDVFYFIGFDSIETLLFEPILFP